MTTISVDEAAKDLPALLQRVQQESVVIRDENGCETMLIRIGPKTDAERGKSWDRLEALSREASKDLERSLAKDGISVEEFLADALADV